MICREYVNEYTGIVYLAGGVTVLVFLTILFLYRSKIIKVNQKFCGVVLALFFVSILGSGVVFISSFFTTALTEILFGNGPIAMFVTLASLFIATLSLVFEFNYATQLVQQGMCKKYEWVAAFGLFMTVIMIFIRVLKLAGKFMGKKEESH